MMENNYLSFTFLHYLCDLTLFPQLTYFFWLFWLLYGHFDKITIYQSRNFYCQKFFLILLSAREFEKFGGVFTTKIEKVMKRFKSSLFPRIKNIRNEETQMFYWFAWGPYLSVRGDDQLTQWTDETYFPSFRWFYVRKNWIPLKLWHLFVSENFFHYGAAALNWRCSKWAIKHVAIPFVFVIEPQDC